MSMRMSAKSASAQTSLRVQQSAVWVPMAHQRSLTLQTTFSGKWTSLAATAISGSRCVSASKCTGTRLNLCLPVPGPIQDIIEFMHKRHGEHVRALLAAYFEHFSQNAGNVSEERGFSYLQFRQKTTMPESKLAAALSQLCSDPFRPMYKIGSEQGGMYKVDPNQIIAVLRTEHVASVVQEKLGNDSARIFRMLLEKKHLEQKQVQTLAIVGQPKETKKLLNQLFRAHFIFLREIPKQVDRAPSRCIFLWGAELERAIAAVLSSCYRAQANLIARRRMIEQRLAELQSKSHLLEDLTQVRAKLFAGIERLQLAGLQIERQIMLLRDY
eukprot:m.35820 g.35820  ORF g.35820 m.35820 type:complete len:327 (+) comp5740_c0_seq1:569-1549(+)